MDINELLKKANALQASDLHIKVGSPPVLRIFGDLSPLTSGKRLAHEDAMKIALAVMSPGQTEIFKKKNDIALPIVCRGLEGTDAMSLCRGEL